MDEQLETKNAELLDRVFDVVVLNSEHVSGAANLVNRTLPELRRSMAVAPHAARRSKQPPSRPADTLKI